jgi:phosphatidylserine decarboxylase
MPIAREGLREIIIVGLLGGGAAIVAWWLCPPALAVAVSIGLLAIWAFVLWFFRDPPRTRDYEASTFYSPADGRVSDITRLPKCDAIGGPAIRVGITLSVWNVHINRVPAAGVVRSVERQPGAYLVAARPEAADRNEAALTVIMPGSSSLSESSALESTSPESLGSSPALPGPYAVRQVVGIFARRIICHLERGATVTAGQRFGLIKFGSRTELIVPDHKELRVCVRVGDRVRGGLTPLVIQEPTPSAAPATSC